MTRKVGDTGERNGRDGRSRKEKVMHVMRLVIQSYCSCVYTRHVLSYWCYYCILFVTLPIFLFFFADTILW